LKPLDHGSLALVVDLNGAEGAHSSLGNLVDIGQPEVQRVSKQNDRFLAGEAGWPATRR
jgi:hypothetical protein